jgi:hypothetical protein
VHLEHLGESLLTQPAGPAEYAKNPRMRRCEAQRSKSLRELASSLRSHLS